jgi:hypothetical protein
MQMPYCRVGGQEEARAGICCRTQVTHMHQQGMCSQLLGITSSFISSCVTTVMLLASLAVLRGLAGRASGGSTCPYMLQDSK